MTERALSLRQAANCEFAFEPRCRCRCNGAMHGAGRLKIDNVEVTSFDGMTAAQRGQAEQFFDSLPAEDPHRVAVDPVHELGPMRKVVAKRERKGWLSDRGTWLLTLECSHTVERKLSRRPPKKLHCGRCKAAMDLNAWTAGAIGKPAVSSTVQKSVVRPSHNTEKHRRSTEICPKCGMELSQHSKTVMAGETKYYCLRIPGSTRFEYVDKVAHKPKRSAAAGSKMKAATSKKFWAKLRTIQVAASRSGRKSRRPAGSSTRTRRNSKTRS